MALDPNINTLEKAKFREGPTADSVIVAVGIEGAAPAPNGAAFTTEKTITTTPSLASYGVANLVNRTLLYMEPADNGIVWSFDPAMAAYHKLYKDGLVVFDYGDDIDVWVKTLTGTVDMTISEVALG